MSKRRLRITENELQEIGEAVRWCRRKGLDGSLGWYEEHLCFMAATGRVSRDDVDRVVGAGPWSRTIEDDRRERR